MLVAYLSALRSVGDHASAVIRVPVAERLGFGLLDVEAKRAEHGERCDGKDGGSHIVYKGDTQKRPAFCVCWMDGAREVLTSNANV